MNDEKCQLAPIEDAQLVERNSRLMGVRNFFHRLMPTFVHKSQPIVELHTNLGVRRIDLIVPSAEGVRYGGSAMPLTTDES